MQPQGGACYTKEPFTETNVPPILTATISNELTEISLISLPEKEACLLFEISCNHLFPNKIILQFPFMGYDQPNLKNKKSLIADSGIQLSVNGTFLGLLECRKNLAVVRNKHFISIFSDKEKLLNAGHK